MTLSDERPDAAAPAGEGVATRPGADLVTLRRELHGVPEVGLHLPRTQRILLRELESLGLDSITVGRGLSSVTGVLRGASPGPVVLLRADMDALPLRELTGLPYAATGDAMHACGHDLHMAGLIGAARRLAAGRDHLRGSVVFAFQPGEEGHAGGLTMVEEGVLDAAGEEPAAAFAIHAWPTIDRGLFLWRPGPIMAGLNDLRITVTGVGGHASAPFEARDPVPVIAEIVLALQSFVTRRTDVRDPVVLTVTQLLAESEAINVIPDRALLAASVRTLSAESVDRLARELPALSARIAEAHGCTAEAQFVENYPVTVNTEAEARGAAALLAGLFGSERVRKLSSPLMASEDFAFFLNRVPGAFLLMGARPPELPDDEVEPPHSPRARFDDAILDDYATAMVELAHSTLHGPADVRD